MKILLILTLFSFYACTAPLVKIHKKSENYIDIEIASENFYMECGVIDSKKHKSLMVFYAINKNIIYKFNYRRVSNTKSCEKIKKEYKKLVKNMVRVRIVGTNPLEKEKNYLIKAQVPERFKLPSSLLVWTFVRLKTQNGCRAYFKEDCNIQNTP